MNLRRPNPRRPTTSAPQPGTFDPQAGLTLVELMIATVVSGIAISAALAMGYSMMNGYGDHRRSTRVMRAARASLDILSNAIRNASPAVTNNTVYVSVQEDDVACRGVTPAVSVTNSSSASDEVTLIYAAGGVFTTLGAGFSTSDTVLTVLDNTGFRDDDLVLLVDVDAEEAALVRVSQPTSAVTTQLNFGSSDAPGSSPDSIGCSLTHAFPATSLVIRARAERFFIQSAADEIPRLSVDPFGARTNEGVQPMALGVEDLQVVLGVDNGQGTGTPGVDGNLLFVGAAADDDEIVYNVAADSAPAPHDQASNAWRALRITLVARSIEEPASGARDTRPAAEDRPASSIQDRFRRRVLRTVVELRNLAP